MSEKDGMQGPDLKWINSLRRYIGDGKTSPVPTFRSKDGTIDADKTLDNIFGMFNIKPIE